jgi:glycosyltransferase involved in cell wall biosynthesis
MANQTRQLAGLLRTAGADVSLVQVNAPYRPAWAGRLHGIRALFRLAPYIWQLWRTAGKVRLFHVMANSGWSWHLFAAPAIWIGWFRGVRVIVNYRGGEAEEFFSRSFCWVRPSLEKVTTVIVPSGFLADVFNRRGVATRIVPNIVNLDRFTTGGRHLHIREDTGPQLLVTRNLEPIYDIDTALRVLQQVRKSFPGATMTVCGSGPERDRLLALAQALEIESAVVFTGRVENEQIAELYRSADVMVNPSLADNMPNSVLEALASGVPVVSTGVGGVPYLVQHEKTALLAPPGDVDAMAKAVIRVLETPELADRLVTAGLAEIQQYTWPHVRGELQSVYTAALMETGNTEVVGK